MVKVNKSDKIIGVPLTRGTLPIMSWFEYHKQLYIAFEWKEMDNKVKLSTICFDTKYGIVGALFAESPDFLVKVVSDKDVTINYTIAK
jgi:hypothetical protein